MVNNNLIEKTCRDTRDIIVDSVYYSVDVKVLFELLLMKNTSQLLEATLSLRPLIVLAFTCFNCAISSLWFSITAEQRGSYLNIFPHINYFFTKFNKFVTYRALI